MFTKEKPDKAINGCHNRKFNSHHRIDEKLAILFSNYPIH
jgi:hypothetical protein